MTDSALEGLGSGFSVGIDTLALVLVALAAGAAALAATRPWLRRAALATPVLMVVGMLAVTPAALAQKLDVQYDTTPQCVSAEALGPSPAARAERASQRVLESIDHVGYFGGGGGAGVAAATGRSCCSRTWTSCSTTARRCRRGLAGGRGPATASPRGARRHGLRGRPLRSRWCRVGRTGGRAARPAATSSSRCPSRDARAGSRVGLARFTRPLSREVRLRLFFRLGRHSGGALMADPDTFRHGSESYFVVGEGLLTQSDGGRPVRSLAAPTAADTAPPFRFSRIGPPGRGPERAEPRPRSRSP